jgi:His-Xaa-Ser system radical SAM maturase HxsC
VGVTTLIDLAGRLRPLSVVDELPLILRVTTDHDAARPPSQSALLVRGDGDLPAGFGAYLVDVDSARTLPKNAYLLPKPLQYLSDGDVIRIEPVRRRLQTLFRRSSASNSFLVTERCDNYCVMCSQPPKEADDSWLVDDLLKVVPLLDPETESLGITGGEPGLLGPRLLELLGAIRKHLPHTAVHVLSNGRAFADMSFARALAAIGIDDLMIGIPLYSHLPEDHDFVVQARGAFDEAVQGVLNLKRAGVRVELRFVIHRETVAGLSSFAEFVARNLLFVDQVVLMGLELMGFARANMDRLWIDPVDYAPHLATAVETLDRARVRVSIYNHQLCVLPAALHQFCRRSISDWKNWYPDECEACELRNECGGFFASSSLRRSRGIRPLATEVTA